VRAYKRGVNRRQIIRDLGLSGASVRNFNHERLKQAGRKVFLVLDTSGVHPCKPAAVPKTNCV
jgi:hypothetical protein